MRNGLEYFCAADGMEKLDDGIFLEHLTCEKEMPNVEEAVGAFGNPAKDTMAWSHGSSALSDSVMCEKYAAETLVGETGSEEEILSGLEKQGAFDRDFGCTLRDVGTYSEQLGLHVSRESGLSVKDLCESLDNNEKIICAVSSISLTFPELSETPGLSADSYVEVIGLEETAPGQMDVILNDPNASSGGSIFGLDVFMDAWDKSGRYAAIISK